jgi:mannitol-1-/sugar-/sorbitol-6-phosphatase
VLLAARALLFDSDGVLVDSAVDGERAWTQWARDNGLAPEAVLEGVHGRRSKDTVGLHLPESGRAAGLALIEQLEIAGSAATRPIAGAVDLLRSLPVARWAVVTSASEDLLRARFAGAGLPAPPVLVNGDDVVNGKPAPDGYLRAAAELRVPIAECVVFEDSPAGIRAGRDAGVGRVIGVGERALTTHTAPVVRDLRGIRWDGNVVDIPADSLLRSG